MLLDYDLKPSRFVYGDGGGGVKKQWMEKRQAS